MEQITIDPTATEMKYRKTRSEFIRRLIPPILLSLISLSLGVWAGLSLNNHFNKVCETAYGSGAYYQAGSGLCIIGNDVKAFP